MSRLLLSVTVAFVLAACGPAETPEKRTSLGTATSDALSGDLSSTAALATGLNTVWFTLTENGAPVTDATLTLMPVMTMPTKSHACPVVGDVVAEDAAKGLYRGQFVPQMASADMGNWKLDVKVARPSGDKTLSFPITVSDSGMARAFSVTDASTSMTAKYVMSMSFPSKPKVGLNTVVVTLHRMQDMMTFPPFDGATLEMVPEMPSMGHGSSNNVAPTLTSPGRYEGTINFSMMGEWKTTFTVKSGDTTMTKLEFTSSI